MDLQDKIKQGISFETYLMKTEEFVKQQKTSGVQSEEHIGFTKLNLQRMLRVTKTTQLLPELEHTLKAITKSQIWVVLSETWCGDAAQNLPALEIMAKSSPNIELRILFRDEHLDLMDRYLTFGARAIPKLISFDQNFQELFVWGPRPETAQNLAVELTQQGISKAEKGLAIQKWYNADKTYSLQKEMKVLLEKTV